MSEIQTRELALDWERANEGTRTVPVTVSSTYPVDRGGYWEVLDHSPEAVDLSRAPLPLIESHDTRTLNIGVVDKLRVEGDRLRGTLKLGKSKRAEEIWPDIKDGVIRNLSVGYSISQAREDGDKIIATRWAPHEVSLVSVGADPQVGIGRSFPETLTLRKSKVEHTERQQSERERVTRILAIGDRFDNPALAREFVESGRSVEDFNKAMLERMGQPKPISSPDMRTFSDAPTIGLTDKEIGRFSFVKLIRAQLDPQKFGNDAGFELACSRAVAQQMRTEPRGLFVPYEVLAKRDLNVGTTTAGGHTVATDLMAGSFIEQLQNSTQVIRLGARVMSDLVGDVAIPRQTSGATAYWVAEGGDVTESQQAFDQVTLSPKTMGAMTDYTRKLMLQSSIDVESFVRMDLATKLGIELDRAALYGTGASNQPTGLANVTGINTKTFAALGAPTFAEVVELESLIAADNADVSKMAYMTTTAMRGTLKTTEKASNTAQFVWADGRMNGYESVATNQVVANDLWFGAWDQLLIGQWSGVDILVDRSTHSASGGVRVVAFMDTDINVRHPESFCLGNGGV